MDKKKFATLKSLAAPPTVVADVMKAFLLLVYQPEDIQDWKSCQKKMSDPDLMIKMENFDPQYCTLSTAQKAEDLIAAETEESIKVKCFDAVYVYKWTTSMVENVKASGGRKA
eukprot:XP_011421459.1 PREDICTED: uncharacterized protein LOC105324103 isoform X1 [Crassostrea gigas]